MMRIFQIVPTLTYGDAVGNDVLALDQAIKELGFETHIFAKNIGKHIPTETVALFSDFCSLKNDDIIIFHVAISSPLNNWIRMQKCRKIMIYHNITPPDYFLNYSPKAYALCKAGYEEIHNLRDSFDIILADSVYNKQNLRDMGYSCPINILPILIPFDDYKKTPSEKIMKKYSDDGYTNIIFVGRIAPNKCQEDIISSFNEYQQNYNKKSRLFIVGNNVGLEKYDLRLKEYTKRLGVKNVVFTGHCPFDEILAYYHLSDLFLCQSEHEGFCVPLVEAMFFNIPIVAYNSSAISWTLGGGGFLMKEKNPLETAAVMNHILTNNSLKNKIVENQCERLLDFQYKKVKALFWEYLNDFLEGNNER